MNRSRVILVDDDPFFLKLLARQLSQQGVSDVETYTSGATALSAVQGDHDGQTLLFLDLNMPDMDGVEFVRQLGRLRYPGLLALVSGEDERILETASRLASAHSLNVLGHLAKPVEPSALQELLGRAHADAPRSGAKTKSYGPDEIRRAIEGGQLTNFYQPKVEVATGAVRGVETLVRWQHPDDGMVFPDQFIGVAEANGLIDDLTRIVLIGALAQSQRWRGEGFALGIAVNVSMENLTHLDFADFVGNEVERHGMRPQDLVLEVTESRLRIDVTTPLDILTRLRLKRISLSIDDFGTGHSSLAQLRDLPFDELKIDRSFVHGAGQDSTRLAIFCGSLDIAHRLAMKTVAEGVEDGADWALLRREGCDLAQGYFIGKPMPAEALDAWMKEWRDRLGPLTRTGDAERLPS